MKLFTVLAGCLALSVTPVFAGDDEAADKPAFSASRAVTVGAEVVAIDHETREVTLEADDGTTATITASPDVRNLDQVQVGDSVLAEVYEEVSIDVFDNPEGVEPGYGDLVAGEAAEEGEKPGAMVMDTVVITAVVEGIDLEAGTFALRGPEGNVKEFEAANPDNLRRASVGDLVVMTITQAMGILVETPAGD